MAYAVAFVFKNSAYRPGKTRNSVVKGSLLKNLPLYLRYSTIDILWKSYESSANAALGMNIGKLSFKIIVGALTRTGTFNQGLSYFYVQHIDQMNELRRLVKRLENLLEELEKYDGSTDDPKTVKKLVDRLLRTTDLSSQFLRHNF